jgi:hypothetical protein
MSLINNNFGDFALPERFGPVSPEDLKRLTASKARISAEREGPGGTVQPNQVLYKVFQNVFANSLAGNAVRHNDDSNKTTNDEERGISSNESVDSIWARLRERREDDGLGATS